MNDLNEVVERLRTSKQESDEMYKTEGFADGQEWAKEIASAEALRRLASFFRAEDICRDCMMENLRERVARLVYPWEPDGVDEFWEEVSGEGNGWKSLSDVYVEAFIEGALGV